MKRYQNKSNKQLIKILRRHFNKFIRLRDRQGEYFTCIACGQIKHVDQMNAGHFYPAGKVKSLEFNEYNVNGECVHCNWFSGDHLINYKTNLIKKWGAKFFELLELKAGTEKQNGFHKWEKFELIEMIEKYKEKCKELE